METILESGRSEKNYWRDLWHYRELFQVLAWRDFANRYKQTLIGVAWALIRPLITMILFTIVFGKVAKLQSDGNVPYALLVFAGMLPWTFFSTAIADSASSLVGNANLVTKVYFPRIIVPAASVIVAFIDFAINMVLMALLMVWYQFVPSWQILFLPFFVLLAFLLSLGPGLWLSAVTVKFRDFRYITPFLIQLGLYASPVGFSSSSVPEAWRTLYALNPMVGVIDGFRWCLLGAQVPLNWTAIGLSFGISLLFLWFGVRIFRKTERNFADTI